MIITKVLTLAKVSDPSQGFRVLQEDLGWLYIAKKPPSRDNIFSSVEELSMAVGEELFVINEIGYDDLGAETKAAIENWSRA